MENFKYEGPKGVKPANNENLKEKGNETEQPFINRAGVNGEDRINGFNIHEIEQQGTSKKR